MLPKYKQLKTACKFTTDNNPSKYGPANMATIFVGLEDTYTRERLYQMKLDTGKSSVSFGKLVDTASEIALAKDNAADPSGSVLMNKTSGGPPVEGSWTSQSKNAAIVTQILTNQVDF